MTAEELWERSGLSGTYEAWAFGEASDKLAELVVQGIKTATCSAYDLYQTNHLMRIQKWCARNSNFADR